VSVESTKRTGKLDFEIMVSGHLTTEQKASLMVIADKCPIHLFLTRGAKITTVPA
jgi:uncharacterized OsmC-like protein